MRTATTCAEQLQTCIATPRDFTRVDYSDPSNLLPIRQAAKMKCLDCCGGDRKQAAECGVKTCALYPYRAGRSPRPKRELSPEARERAVARLQASRLAQNRPEALGAGELEAQGCTLTPTGCSQAPEVPAASRLRADAEPSTEGGATC